MITALVSKQFVAAFGDALKAVVERSGKSVQFKIPPEAQGARLSPADRDLIDCAFLDRDMRFNEQTFAVFDDAMRAGKNVKWLHLASSGLTPAPFIDAMVEKKGIITSSTGSNAEPVAQTGFTGLLMLARGFPGYIQAQHKREWRPIRGAALPDDLRGQTVLLIGVGAVGKAFTGYAHAFGLKVIGVRRSPLTPQDTVDELHHPSKLHELLPRADWIVIAAPLTKETRNLVSADALKRVRKGARLINVARGEIVDEAAMIEALRDGRLAGAHLDAHTTEPLPNDSPLWNMPNVIVTPHNAAASKGNEKRCAEIFIANFGHWVRGEAMFNVQTVSF
jgi:D-2-hydroxyacid dehydrogenase (NADP+)